MYKLFIQNKAGIWKIADLGDDKPAMNYQVNNIAELKDRQNNYSQSLKMPKSKLNCEFFGFIDSDDVVTDIPYQKHNCRLFSDDYILAGPGSYLILDKVTEFFEVQILSGNSDFFTTLENSKMSDLDLGSMIRSYIVTDPSNFTDEFCFAAATFIKGGDQVMQSTIEHLFPFIYLKKAIENLITQNGYTLLTNLLDAQWNKKAISLCSLTPSLDSFKSVDAITEEVSNNNPGYRYFPLVKDGSGRAVNYVGTMDGPYPYLSTRYIPTFDCTVTVNFKVNTLNGEGGHFRIATVSSTGEVLETHYESDVSNNTIVIPINLSKGDILDIYLKTYAISSMTTNLKWDILADTVYEDCLLTFSNNLGFDSQFDFFKAFVQLFGLTVDVDNENKIVRAFTMQKLYDNKPIAKDWSSKLHETKSKETNFTLLNATYAQSNYIRFDDNSDDNVTDSGFFLVPNETLTLTQDLFSVKFEAGLDSFIGSNLVANVPIEEKDTDGVITFKGGKPHIVDISENTIAVTVSGSVLPYPIATHSKMQSFIDTYYTGLIQMLTGTKYKIDYFYLIDKEIEDFDPFIPVYIQKYGAYFYICKINNYISKQITKIDLIKL